MTAVQQQNLLDLEVEEARRIPEEEHQKRITAAR